MAEFVYDTFTDDDTTALTSDHAGETGAAWSIHEDYAYDFGIYSNKAYGVISGSVASGVLASGVPSGNDYELEAELYLATTSQDRGGIWGRVDAAQKSGYVLSYYELLTTYRWNILRVNSDGTTTLLGSWTENLANGNSRVVKLNIQGDTLKGYISDTERISVTDSTWQTGGRVGMWSSNSSTSTTGTHFLYFKATDIGEPATGQPRVLRSSLSEIQKFGRRIF